MGNKSSLMLQDDEIKKISEETGFTASQIEKLYTRFSHLDRNNRGSLNRDDLLSIPELAINPLCDRLIQMFFYDCQGGDDERINFKQFMKILAIFRASSSSSPASALTDTTLTHNTNVQDSVLPNAFGGLEKRSHSKKISADTVNKNVMPDRKQSRDKQLDSKTEGKLNDNLKNKLLFVFRIYDADNDGKISFHDLKSILKMMVGSYIEDVQLDKITNRAFMEVDEDNDGYIEFSEFCKVFRGKDMDDKLRVKFFN